MNSYALLYRFGFTPWERYGEATAGTIANLFDREEHERTRPLGRALDLGCGRGQYTPELARRGWDAVGVDSVPQAVEAARRRETAGATYVVGDVTDLTAAGLGTFDFFLDVGCFQGFGRGGRAAEGRGVTDAANPDATLLVLAFGPTPLRSVIGGVSQHDVVAAFKGWDLVSVAAADTAGLGWPMNRTAPQWFRLRRAPAG